MRQLSSLLCVSVLSALGCGQPAASTDRPAPVGEFRVLLPSRPTSLNPNLELDELAILIGRSLFNHLLTINESGRLLPELAESWTISPDGRTYTFKLRPNVRWHDGAPFSSADVRWTYEHAVKDAYGGRSALGPVQAIDDSDPATVVFTLRHPWAPFAADLAGPGLAILPRHVYQDADWRVHPANDRPIGTGAFKFGRWADDDTLILDANPDYFRSGPYVQRVVFAAANSDVARERMLRGDADYSVVRLEAVNVAAPPDPIVARTLPTSGRHYLAMNLRRQPFADVRVREAMARAVDRLQLVSKGLAGLGAPAVGWYTPDVEWAYNSAARVPEYDLDRARELLDAAGLRAKRGERFRATLTVPDTPHFRDVGELLRRQFAAVGIGIDLDRQTIAEWPKRVLQEHAFDLTLMSGGQGPDPDQLRRRFLAGTELGDFLGYDDPEFREAVERGARVVDVAERAAAYYRAQEILARDVPFIPLAESVRVVVYNRRVSGLPQLEARGLVGGFDFSLVKLGDRPAATTR